MISTKFHGNSPHPDGLVLRETWRRPHIPFKNPECCGVRTSKIRFNIYRCKKCAARIEPERLYHRLLWWRNPFRQDKKFRHIFKVVRWAKPKERK